MIDSFHRHNRITPSSMPLISFLCGCLPVVYDLGWLGIACGFLVLCVLVVLETRWTAFFLLLVFLFGLSRSCWMVSGHHNPFGRCLPRDECHSSIICRITDSPRIIGHNIRFQGEITDMEVCGHICQTSGGILVELPIDQAASLSVYPDYGDVVSLDGYFWKIDTSSPGYGRHLYSLGLTHGFRAFSVSVVAPCSGFRLLYRHFLSCRELLGGYLASDMPVSTGNLYQSMVLGRKELFPSETRRQFIRAATLHIFAISGLHVNVIHTFIILILGRMGLRLKHVQAIGLALCFLYVLLTGITPSSLRALFMAALASASLVLRRGANPRHTLLLAALVELSWNPLWLYNSGFLFSFCVVFALVYGVTAVEYVRDILFEQRLWRLSRSGGSFHLSLFKASGSMLFAWLSSAPIAMHLNGILPLGALAVGLSTQQVSGWLVWLAIPKTAVSAIAKLPSGIAACAADAMMSFLIFMADIGGAKGMYLLRPILSGAAAATMLAAVALLAIAWRFAMLRRMALAVIACWLAGVFFLDSHPRLLLALGNDGGVPAACVFTDNAPPDIICPGGRKAAMLLKNGILKNGFEDIGYLPVFPSDEQPTGAEILAAALVPRVIGMPKTTRSGTVARMWKNLSPRIHTHLLAKAADSPEWRATYGNLRISQKNRSDGISVRARLPNGWLSVDCLDTGQCVVLAKLDGMAFSRVLTQSSQGQLIAMTK